jgi:type VI secretion system secreted protein VgrG
MLHEKDKDGGHALWQKALPLAAHGAHGTSGEPAVLAPALGAHHSAPTQAAAALAHWAEPAAPAPHAAAAGGHPAPAAHAPSAQIEQTGLGSGVDTVAAKSETLEHNLVALHKAGWVIKYGDKGGGSFTDRDSKTITVDAAERGHTASVLQTLAHESGHASYTPDAYSPPDGLTRQQYVDRNVDHSLKDEGEATITNLLVRRQLLAAHQVDIGVAGQQSDKYQQLFAQHQGHLNEPGNRDQLREQIGQVFAKGEHPSTDPKKNYYDYYAKSYGDFYDKQVAPH